MGLMANRAGNLTQVGLVGIAVFELLGFCFQNQFFHGSMAFEALLILHRRVRLGCASAMAIHAGDVGFRMEVVHIVRTRP